MRGTQLIDRVLDVLESFSPGNDGMTVAEITRKVNMAQPTVYRIVTALERRHFLIRDQRDKRFHLGPRLIHLGNIARESYEIGTIALPILRKLAEESGETVHLAVAVSDTQGVFIEKVESSQSVRLHTVIGQPVPLYTGSTLKVILAFMPEETWETVIRHGLTQLANKTITDPDVLREHLRDIRSKGYAVSREELFNGAGAVAAPILSASGKIVAGLGISGPAYRLTDEQVARHIELARAAAVEIGRLVP